MYCSLKTDGTGDGAAPGQGAGGVGGVDLGGSGGSVDAGAGGTGAPGGQGGTGGAGGVGQGGGAGQGGGGGQGGLPELLGCPPVPFDHPLWQFGGDARVEGGQDRIALNDRPPPGNVRNWGQAMLDTPIAPLDEIGNSIEVGFRLQGEPGTASGNDAYAEGFALWFGADSVNPSEPLTDSAPEALGVPHNDGVALVLDMKTESPSPFWGLYGRAFGDLTDLDDMVDGESAAARLDVQGGVPSGPIAVRVTMTRIAVGEVRVALALRGASGFEDKLFMTFFSGSFAGDAVFNTIARLGFSAGARGDSGGLYALVGGVEARTNGTCFTPPPR